MLLFNHKIIQKSHSCYLTDQKYKNILFALNYVALISSHNQLISDPQDEYHYA